MRAAEGRCEICDGEDVKRRIEEEAGKVTLRMQPSGLHVTCSLLTAFRYFYAALYERSEFYTQECENCCWNGMFCKRFDALVFGVEEDSIKPVLDADD